MRVALDVSERNGLVILLNTFFSTQKSSWLRLKLLHKNQYLKIAAHNGSNVLLKKLIP